MGKHTPFQDEAEAHRRSAVLGSDREGNPGEGEGEGESQRQGDGEGEDGVALGAAATWFCA
ncbi:MAG: hypothetical protein DRP82_00230 [Planctomycetota bacterium]|nr:MAG: hypothetical protein DRP82_00230 [Planctomycetota bacterium]